MANGFNFAREPFVNERLPRLLLALSVVLVLALTALHGFLLGRYLLREQESLDVRVEEIREELLRTDESIAAARAALAREQQVLGDERTQFLMRLFRRKSFSWTGLFNELEEITPAPVRVTSIAPFENEGEISVTLTVVGRTLQDILDMVRALESSSFFATVFPLEEAALDESRGLETGIAATLELQYVEDARRREEPKPEPTEASSEGEEKPPERLENPEAEEDPP